MSIKGRTGLGVLAALAIAACAAPEEADVASSEAASTSRPYVQENRPYWWADSSYDEFVSAQARTFGQTLPAALPDDDALTVRIQTWLDRLHAVVKRDVERSSGRPFAAPRPIAKVLLSKATFNAWVSGVPACVGSPFGRPQAVTGLAAYLDRDRVMPMVADGCVRAPGWRKAEAVSFWNEGRLACALSDDGDSVSARGSGCSVEAQASDDVAIAAASPFIQFTTDLVSELEEKSLVVVAAHELGHYYRGHATVRGHAKYGFWYERENGRKTLPVPASNAAELEAAYKEVVQEGRVLGGPSFASRYSARSRRFLLTGLAPLLAARTESGFVCAAARDALGPWTDAILQSEAPSEEARAAYLAYESKLAACAPRLALKGDVTATSISAGSVLFAAGAARPGPKAKISLRIGDTLGTFLDRFDAQAKELDGKAARLMARLKANKIGLYTTEQEADELALELATKVGLTSAEVLAGWVDFMGAVDRVYARAYAPEDLAAWRASSGELDAPTCEALLLRDFTKNGAPVTVGMGQLDEPHHASCYRLFNMWREARARQFVPAAPLAELSPPWETLRTRAAQLSAEQAE